MEIGASLTIVEKAAEAIWYMGKVFYDKYYKVRGREREYRNLGEDDLFSEYQLNDFDGNNAKQINVVKEIVRRAKQDLITQNPYGKIDFAKTEKKVQYYENVQGGTTVGKMGHTLAFMNWCSKNSKLHSLTFEMKADATICLMLKYMYRRTIVDGEGGKCHYSMKDLSVKDIEMRTEQDEITVKKNKLLIVKTYKALVKVMTDKIALEKYEKELFDSDVYQDLLSWCTTTFGEMDRRLVTIISILTNANVHGISVGQTQIEETMSLKYIVNLGNIRGEVSIVEEEVGFMRRFIYELISALLEQGEVKNTKELSNIIIKGLEMDRDDRVHRGSYLYDEIMRLTNRNYNEKSHIYTSVFEMSFLYPDDPEIDVSMDAIIVANRSCYIVIPSSTQTNIDRYYWSVVADDRGSGVRAQLMIKTMGLCGLSSRADKRRVIAMDDAVRYGTTIYIRDRNRRYSTRIKHKRTGNMLMKRILTQLVMIGNKRTISEYYDTMMTLGTTDEKAMTETIFYILAIQGVTSEEIYGKHSCIKQLLPKSDDSCIKDLIEIDKPMKLKLELESDGTVEAVKTNSGNRLIRSEHAYNITHIYDEDVEFGEANSQRLTREVWIG